MASFIIWVILVLILIGMISIIVKKVKQVRASFRERFGGGEEKTREDATKIMSDASKDNCIPSWAIEDAAEELYKYNLGENPRNNQAILRENLRNEGFKIYDLPKEMVIPRNTSKEEAGEIIKGYLRKLNVRYYKEHNDLKDKDKTLVDRCMNAYYFSVNSCTAVEATEAVAYLVDQWKADVEDGKIA